MNHYAVLRKKRTFAQTADRPPVQKDGAGAGEQAVRDIPRHPEENAPEESWPATRRLKGRVPDEPLPLERAGASRLARQMCVSFFRKWFEQEHYECYLLRILERLGIRMEDSELLDAGFDHCPVPEEGTCFDLYLRLNDGRRLFWSACFGEGSFGRLPRSRSGAEGTIRDWEQLYTPLLRKCVYHELPDVTCEEYCCLSTGGLNRDCPVWRNCPIHEFYRFFQIRRSILHAGRKGDCVLFLSPLSNRKLEEERAYIGLYAKRWDTDNIRAVYWEQLISVTMQTVAEEPELLDYYRGWRERYLPEASGSKYVGPKMG